MEWQSVQNSVVLVVESAILNRPAKTMPAANISPKIRNHFRRDLFRRCGSLTMVILYLLVYPAEPDMELLQVESEWYVFGSLTVFS